MSRFGTSWLVAEKFYSHVMYVTLGTVLRLFNTDIHHCCHEHPWWINTSPKDVCFHVRCKFNLHFLGVKNSYIQHVCLFFSSPRPLMVEPLEQRDEEDGLPERFIMKNAGFHRERENGPRFAGPNSFEYEFAQRWKELYRQESRQLEQAKQNFIDAGEKLEMEMESAQRDHQAMMLRQDLMRRQEELRQLEEMRAQDDARRKEMEIRYKWIFYSQTCTGAGWCIAVSYGTLMIVVCKWVTSCSGMSRKYTKVINCTWPGYLGFILVLYKTLMYVDLDICPLRRFQCPGIMQVIKSISMSDPNYLKDMSHFVNFRRMEQQRMREEETERREEMMRQQQQEMRLRGERTGMDQVKPLMDVSKRSTAGKKTWVIISTLVKFSLFSVSSVTACGGSFMNEKWYFFILTTRSPYKILTSYQWCRPASCLHALTIIVILE